MTPDENVRYWETLSGTVASAATDVVNAMTETFQGRVQNVELKMISHSPGMFWKAFPGLPPAYASGNLARSIERTPAIGNGTSAFASVYTSEVYAAIQEFGGYTWGNRGLMHWTNSAGSWFMNDVKIPEHPYFRPALEAVIRDGRLQGSAIAAFTDHLAPVLR